MIVYRKRNKFGNFGGNPEDRDPISDLAYQMGAEQAARIYASALRGEAPYDPNNFIASPAVVAVPDISSGIDENYMDDETELGTKEKVRSSPLHMLASAIGLRRSKSRQRTRLSSRERFNRAGSSAHFLERPVDSPVPFHRRSGSPAHFFDRPIGSPVPFHPRPGSPELVQPRPSSPHFLIEQRHQPTPSRFVPIVRSAPADVARRVQRAQLSHELQRIEQQNLQQEMVLGNSTPMIHNYQLTQQPYYSMNPYMNAQRYSMIPQTPMYSLY